MKTICGMDCSGCSFQDSCKGCAETGGHPLGGECIAAECYKSGGQSCFLAYKNRLIEEFQALGIPDMPAITTLCQLSGAYINMEYTLPNGQKIKLLDDTKIYLGYQLEKAGSDRCYGLGADDSHLLVCEYGCNGAEPEIIVYKKRTANAGLHGNMCTEKDNEELIEALVKAARAAFLSLKETAREHFYFYAFIFDEGLHPYISAWSYEALEKSMLEQQIPEEDKSWWKWDSADSPYAGYGYDEFFGEVSELLDKRADGLSDDELYGTEWAVRIDSMEEAMKRLDSSGLFGTGKERERVVINAEQAPPDEDGSEYSRALRLNPSSALLSEYLETCE